MAGYSFIRGTVAAAAVAALAVGGASGCKVRTTAPGDGKAPAYTASNAPPTRAPAPGKPGGAGAGPTTKKPHRPPVRTPPKRPAPPLMTPGSQGAQVRELQARLHELALFDRGPTGYYGSITASAVRSFQAGHRLAVTGAVDSGTWSTLRSLTRQPERTALYPRTSRPLARPDARCLTGRVLCISKSSSTLAWMVDGRVVSAMDVRFGSQYTPTREGSFGVTFKSRHHVSTIYHTPMPYAMFFSGGQAVHYSADFAARGYTGASHGCVNVRDQRKIAAVFAQVRTGDKVVIYR
ncbi:L,D-transpeptidase family protein [Streptomyces sp. 8N706]|uniref:L,D-transpeptidase family protein n=1 Tax=Streptomyces sp. 8N706 TaxID=3457416 RepID=UPI003FD56F0D